MRIQRRASIVALAAAAVMATGMLAGCGGDDSNDADDSTDASSESSQEHDEGEAGAEGHGDSGDDVHGDDPHGDDPTGEEDRAGGSAPAPKVSFNELEKGLTWESTSCTPLDEYGKGTIVTSAESDAGDSLLIQFQHSDGSDPILDAVTLSLGRDDWSPALDATSTIEETSKDQYQITSQLFTPTDRDPKPFSVTFTCD